MKRVENGERMPTVRADRVDGDPMTLPDDLEGRWALVVFYRGHW